MSTKINRREFVTAIATASGAAAMPAMTSAAPVRNNHQLNAPVSGGSSRDVAKVFATPFPLQNVRLSDGPFKNAAEANLRYLKSLPLDRLLHTFRLEAGIASSAEPLGEWEKPDCQLRGHFAGGHYLSACALAYASSGDEELKRNGDIMVTELAKCQAQHHNGYLSAFPEGLFDRLREGIPVWAPFYTLHKIMAGHLDMYQLAGNMQALETLEKMAGWVRRWIDSLSEQHLQRILLNEYGGMGEVLANLYAVTGKNEYLTLAKRFDKHSFVEPLGARRDELKGLHANTHIPQVIAAARLYELTDEERYRIVANYFWSEVTAARCYCTGGTSNYELWKTDAGMLADQLSPHTAENCCAYNMLKLTRHLFSWEPNAQYMDYYERVLFNHRLGTIDMETGTTGYFLPLGNGYSKIFAKPFDAYWCCNGTAAEEFAKLTDTIYFHDDHSVYVNLYIASELNWPEKGLRLTQQANFPSEQRAVLMIASKSEVDVDLKLRIPYWTNNGFVRINGKRLPVFANPGSYLVLRGPWKNGDQIELELPMQLRSSPLPGSSELQAVMYGPLVLAARGENTQKDLWYRGNNAQEKQAPEPTLEFHGKSDDPASWLQQVKYLTFRSKSPDHPVEFVPLSQIIHECYAVYHKVHS